MEKILIIGQRNNIFAKQLNKDKDLKLQFMNWDAAPDFYRNLLAMDWHKMLVINYTNKQVEYLATKILDQRPLASIMLVRSGSKTRKDKAYKYFEPHLIHVYGHDDCNYVPFESWADFVNKVKIQHTRIPPVYKHSGQGNIYTLNDEVPADFELAEPDWSAARKVFRSGLQFSEAFLDFKINWLEEIKRTDFTVKFNYPRNNKKTIRHLTMPQQYHQHLPVFTMDSKILFFGPNEIKDKNKQGEEITYYRRRLIDMVEKKLLKVMGIPKDIIEALESELAKSHANKKILIAVGRVIDIDETSVKIDLGGQASRLWVNSIKCCAREIYTDLLITQRFQLFTRLSCNERPRKKTPNKKYENYLLQSMLTKSAKEPEKYALSLLLKDTPSKGRNYSYPESLQGDLQHDPTIDLSGKGALIARDNSQMEVIRSVQKASQLAFFEGSPGTGKTHTAAILARDCYKKGKTVMVVGHSNRSVDTLLDAIFKSFGDKINKDKIIRFGSFANVTELAKEFYYDHSEVTGKYIKKKDSEDYELEETKVFLTKEEVQDLRARHDQTTIYEDYKEGPWIIGCTETSMLWDFNFMEFVKRNPIHIAFVDEATRGFPHELLPTLAISEKVVFLGDHRQLGNIDIPDSIMSELMNRVSQEYNIDLTQASQDARAYAAGFFATLVSQKLVNSKYLRVNRRSLPNIARFISNVFYDEEIIPGRFSPNDQGEIKIIDTSQTPDNEEKSIGTSFANEKEAKIVVREFIKRAAETIRHGGQITDLAIITPYLAQISLIKEELRAPLLFTKTFNKNFNAKNIEQIIDKIVITVDAAQGSERKIIFLSLVRSNHNGQIGFNKDLNRLNVSLSRSQDGLIIVGDMNTFLGAADPEARNVFGKLIEYVKNFGVYVLN